ncbi:alpha/beta-hydrolase [Westerdykella ornata]|uniref:Alpha/beta-hydrolase n=1 Tax=Westerdykella ornata TaxID=318751 RepID=A0A6A6J9H9_WESOR|nr:alpha/beta-hydrolase [Westerdykella ornata]KAF2272864.1 alpha/beta-hydrolase [Westerdykella ornata]
MVTGFNDAFMEKLLAPFLWPGAKAKDSTAMTVFKPPRNSQIRLDNDASATFTLSDGRKLGYAQYGSLTEGTRTFFYLHGHPGSRLEAAWFEELCQRLGARVIGVDRFGVGLSSPHPKGTLLDHAKDVEELAKHLGLASYGVLGISGGGPYALACAASMPPDKLKCVSIVTGMGPADIGFRGAILPLYLGFTFVYPYFPGLVKWYWRRWEPVGRLDLTDEQRLQLILERLGKSKLHPRDRETLDEGVLRMHVRSTRECFSQGFDAVAQDARLMTSKWGFRVEDIREDLEVQLWYGTQDTNIPLRHGEGIAAKLGGRAKLRVEDETHGSMQIRYLEEIVESLVARL